MKTHNTSFMRTVCIAVALMFGATVAYGLPVFWTFSTYCEWRTHWRHEIVWIEPDGTVLLATHKGNHYDFRTLEGEPAPQEAAFARVSSSETPAGRADAFNEMGWLARVAAFADGGGIPTYWYFLADDDSVDGRGYFVGFDAETGLKAGYLGTTGFSNSVPPRSAQFSVYGARLYVSGTFLTASNYYQEEGFSPAGPVKTWPGQAYDPWIIHMQSGGDLLEVNLNDRTVKPLVGIRDIISIGSISRPETTNIDVIREAKSRNITEYALRRPDRVTVLNPTNGSSRDYAIPAELRETDFALHPIATNQDAIMVVTQIRRRGEQRTYEVFHLDSSGQIVRRDEIQSDTGLWAPSRRTNALAIAAAVPSPSLLGPLLGALLASDPGGGLVSAIRDVLPAVTFALLTSLALTFLTVRWQRQHHLPLSYAWLAFVFLFGLPGYIGYRLHRRWPIREQAPPPVLTGVEIFA